MRPTSGRLDALDLGLVGDFVFDGEALGRQGSTFLRVELKVGGGVEVVVGVVVVRGAAENDFRVARARDVERPFDEQGSDTGAP